MKRKITAALLIGVVLSALSLLIRTGEVHTDPMAGCDACVHGLAIRIPAQTISTRGFPLPILTITTDDDSPHQLYWGYNLAGTAADVAIFSVLGFGVAYCLLLRSK